LPGWGAKKRSYDNRTYQLLVSSPVSQNVAVLAFFMNFIIGLFHVFNFRGCLIVDGQGAMPGFLTRVALPFIQTWGIAEQLTIFH
jgi:hypothetical protein